MKSVYYLLALVTIVGTPAYSQKDKGNKGPEFGSVTMEEISMTVYDKDSSASAVILFDRGSNVLEDNFNSSYKRHVRIKFFTQEAIKEWTEMTLTFSNSDGGVSKIKGATYNLDGGKMVVTELTDANIFKSKADKFRNRVKFTLPNVRPGSVIEYTYTLYGTGLLFPWTFQHNIPTILSEYELSTPTRATFRKEMRGSLSVSDYVTKNDGAYQKWTIRDAPAFKEEPFITTAEDYVSNIDFYLTEYYIPGQPIMNFQRSWNKISKDYSEDVDMGNSTKATGWMKPLVDENVPQTGTPDERAAAVYYFVKKKLKWNGDVTKWLDGNLRRVWDKGEGTSADLNLTLVAMLQRAGFDASPVVISTRNHGRINQFAPQGESFNDVICLVNVNGKERLLDATDRNLPMNTLPQRCLNGEGLLVTDKEPRFIPLTTSKSRTVENVDLKINEAGEMDGVITIIRDGHDAGRMRRQYNEDGKEKYVKSFLEGKTWEISKSDFNNIEEVTGSPKEIHQVSIRDHVQSAGDVMYINPYVANRMEKNIFKSPTREYAVDLPTTFDEFYVAKLQIPEGFVVEEVPQSKSMALPEGFGRYVYQVSVSGSTINVVSQLTLAKTVIPPDYYEALREFYALIVAKQAEQIVLKKKT